MSRMIPPAASTSDPTLRGGIATEPVAGTGFVVASALDTIWELRRP